MALILMIVAIPLLASPATKSVAAYHVRLPGTVLIPQPKPEWSRTEIAAWVQAIGSIAAILAALWIANRAYGRSVHVFEETRQHEERDRRAEAERHERVRQAEAERRRQRILSSLYVEVFARALRCARDADTWRKEVDREQQRQRDVKVTPGRRTIMDLLKFEPSAPIVYLALAESHGLLESDAQAALSEFYYCLEAIIRDINRFSRKAMGHNYGARRDLTRHFPDNLQIESDDARIPPPWKRISFRSHPTA